MSPHISVVIPAVNEAATLANLLADLAAQRGVELQVIVVDGGSADDSVQIARAKGATVIRSVANRAMQMNVGAGQSAGEWLCFVHADSRLTHPDQLGDAVVQLQAAGRADTAGHFALRFDRPAHQHRFLYRFMEAKSASGRRYTVNGDQGLVLHRDFFERLQGFDVRLPFLEDQRIAAAIDHSGRWCLLAHRIETSARRFETEGRNARYLLMALIMAMYVARVPSFFARAQGVYALQRDTHRLRLLAYYGLLYRMMRACGWRESLRVGWRIAGIALRQSWQPFLALDVWLARSNGAQNGFFMGLHDRWLQRFIVHPPAQMLVGVLLLITIFGPIQLWCALRETFEDRS